METNDIVISGLQLKKLLSKKADPIIHEFNLRPVELDLLVFLNEERSIDTAKGIVGRKHLSKAHISKSIEHLRSGGFISVSEDASDHRIMHISLTEKSRDVINKVNSIYVKCKDVLEDGISPEELEICRNVIRKMINNINRELGE